MIDERTKKEIEWIEKSRKITVSKFMKEVLDILSQVYSGLHHTDYYTQFKRKDYCEKNNAVYHERHRNSFSTYDYSELTKLVILAHDKGIRIEISHPGYKNFGLKIHFGNRMGRQSMDLSMNRRHPKLKEAIERVRG